MVFSIGMNDCGISGGDYGVSKTEYRENVEEIIDKASHLADQVIAVGLSPVDEEELADSLEASRYLNSGVREYEEILKRACSQEGVEFIPTFDSLAEGETWNQKLFDGLHPNTRGHQEIYEIVGEPIKSELEFEYSR